MKQTVEQASQSLMNIHWNDFSRETDKVAAEHLWHKAFQEGAEWQAKQNPWRNFKEERPNPNSHILRKMTHPGYRAYGKVIYYADFWGEDRLDKWEQDDDRVIYEWQYINE